MAGLSGNLTPSSINATLGAIALQLHQAIRAVEQGQELLTVYGTVGLEAAPISMSAGDATALVDAFTNLALLARIYRGVDSLPGAQDFSADVKALYGMGQ